MTETSVFPVSSPTKSYWHSENDDFASSRTTPELPEKSDIVIIGAGYAGSSTAYWLYKNSEEYVPDILMLEARTVCSGATGRNGGHLKPDYYREYLKFEKLYGKEGAAEIGHFEHDHLEAIKQVVEELQIDCDFILTRACNVHLTEGAIQGCLKAVASLRENPHFKLLNDIQVIEGDHAKLVSRVPESPVALTFTAGHLWPYKFVKGLLEYCIKRGLNLQTNTCVENIETLPDGSYLVKTQRGNVRATKVIVATNAYTSGIIPEFNDKIVPVKGTCCHIKVSESTKHDPYLTHSYGICRDYSEHEYLINRPDGSVIVGGAKPFYLKDKDSWYNNVDDSTLFEGDIRGWYEEFMQSNFSSWDDVKTKVDYLWTGILGYSVDSLPWIGEVPDQKNKYVLAGFNGHGMPRAFLSAKAISKAVLQNCSITDTEIPRSFILTEERLTKSKNTILRDAGYYKYHE
ncbi:hypothetical protein OGAPHI_005395 [Ogataea philodendri]|uniref:FAD dependent oxidoreductase domain-containing protein n=1 Tax=Ogataea philodendri TaxID=1378263 RepID=A0A9P8P172_9ASCO|nr:uncharacterized protein OGAPHI_005395 [Ogataea philodendri]KAH3663405.1 hypothetical protein OGAPHI_005395 [Ogataea philodendri]